MPAGGFAPGFHDFAACMLKPRSTRKTYYQIHKIDMLRFFYRTGIECRTVSLNSAT